MKISAEKYILEYRVSLSPIIKKDIHFSFYEAIVIITIKGRTIILLYPIMTWSLTTPKVPSI